MGLEGAETASAKGGELTFCVQQLSAVFRLREQPVLSLDAPRAMVHSVRRGSSYER